MTVSALPFPVTEKRAGADFPHYYRLLGQDFQVVDPNDEGEQTWKLVRFLAGETTITAAGGYLFTVDDLSGTGFSRFDVSAVDAATEVPAGFAHTSLGELVAGDVFLIQTKGIGTCLPDGVITAGNLVAPTTTEGRVVTATTTPTFYTCGVIRATGAQGTKAAIDIDVKAS